MGRLALITGATGFVGGHLSALLASQGWQLRALVRSTSDSTRLRALGVELYPGGLFDRDAVLRATDGAEVVFHLAAVTGLRTEKDFDRANVEGTRNVVAAARSASNPPRRLVYLSSYAACGPSEPDRPRAATEAPRPMTAYGRTKLAGEEIVRSLSGTGTASVVLRAPPVFGPGDHAFLPYFRVRRYGVAPAPAGRDRQIHRIYVEDLARALLHAADAPSGIYPVADPTVYRWSAVVDAMARELGKHPVRVRIPARLVRAAAGAAETVGGWLGRATVFNREKADEMLAPAWVCDLSGSDALLPRDEVTRLDEGISRTVRWYTRQGWL